MARSCDLPGAEMSERVARYVFVLQKGRRKLKDPHLLPYELDEPEGRARLARRPDAEEAPVATAGAPTEQDARQPLAP